VTIPLQIQVTDHEARLEASGMPYGISMQSELEFAFIVEENGELAVLTPYEFACRSAACRPPTSGGTGGSNPGGGRIASRLPKGGPDHDVTGLHLENLSQDNIAAQVARLHQVGAVPKGFDTTDKVIGFMEKNIQSVLDQVSMEDRNAWKKWYEAANQMGSDIASETGVSHVGANAMIAALSPGTDWNINVAMARSAAKTLSENEPVSAETAKIANALLQEKWARELTSFGRKKDKEQANHDKLVSERDSTTDPKAIKKLDAAIAKKREILDRSEPPQPDLNHFKKGQKPGDLDPLQAAYLVRASDPNPTVRNNKVNPDGTYDDSDLMYTKAGKPQSGTWQSYENIAKAINVYRDPSIESISRSMGEAHKVRTFFNNINNPNDPRNEATIDTHSAGISVGVALSINHPWIAAGGNSMMSSPRHVADGTSGTYSIMAEAHRRVAKANDLLPRELQSITWEQWRRMHDKTSRRGVSTAAREAVA
jgi:hypothetical protein